MKGEEKTNDDGGTCEEKLMSIESITASLQTSHKSINICKVRHYRREVTSGSNHPLCAKNSKAFYVNVFIHLVDCWKGYFFGVRKMWCRQFINKRTCVLVKNKERAYFFLVLNNSRKLGVYCVSCFYDVTDNFVFSNTYT